MKFPDVAYIAWAKSLPSVEINLARSGVEPCPASLLGIQGAEVVTLPTMTHSDSPLRLAIARRYGVQPEQVLPLSGGTSYANWVACAALLDGYDESAEVIVERPTYEPLLQIPRALGHSIRRLDRCPEEDFRIDLDSFESLVSARTRLAIVSNLHNPSGARIEPQTLRAMARMLDRVGAVLLVDEVYLECTFHDHADSCVHAGANVVTTNSLTKAYGLDGLRSGWILGPAWLIKRADRINDLIANGSVAPGQQMALAAFQRIGSLAHRARAMLAPNLACARSFLERERRLTALLPDGGTIAFARLPSGIDDERFSAHLIDRYSTLVVPGYFFETPGYIRIGLTANAESLHRGLANVSHALDDLIPGDGGL
jgi:aspartate/methionine/tyrosine aminotransferase